MGDIRVEGIGGFQTGMEVPLTPDEAKSYDKQVELVVDAFLGTLFTDPREAPGLRFPLFVEGSAKINVSAEDVSGEISAGAGVTIVPAAYVIGGAISVIGEIGVTELTEEGSPQIMYGADLLYHLLNTPIIFGLNFSVHQDPDDLSDVTGFFGLSIGFGGSFSQLD